jgi:hypothetical protein
MIPLKKLKNNDNADFRRYRIKVAILKNFFPDASRFIVKIKIKKLHDPDTKWKYQKNTPEDRLNILEQLRLEAGKFLYEYPTGFRRVFKIIRKK